MRIKILFFCFTHEKAQEAQKGQKKHKNANKRIDEKRLKD